MAVTTNHVNNELIKFRRTAAFDFLRKSRFDPFMGADSTSVIVRLSDLTGDGKEINIPLVTQLTGMGVGAGLLRGNEEQLDSYGYPIWADWARNAVANNRAVNKESSFNIRSTARSLLSGWARRVVRDDIVDALLSIPTGAVQAGRLTAAGGGNRINGVKWSASTTTQQTNWMLANTDRVLFGSVVGNQTSTFAASLNTIDTVNDKMTAAVGSLMKNIAQQTGVVPGSPGIYNGRPKITPFQQKGTDQEWYICFLGSRAMRDLKTDPTMYQANRDAREREGADPTKVNPIFTGGGLIYDGVIYLEIPEITQRLLLTNATPLQCEPVFLCGQGAYAYAMGQMPRPTQLEDGDYDFITGMGIEAQYGIGKVAKASLFDSSNTLVDWGVVTGFVSGQANA